MTASLPRLLLAALLVLCAADANALPLGAHILSLRADQAIAQLPAGASPLVAVLDTGFEVDHPALRDKLVTGYNALTGTTDVAIAPTDVLLYTHGTAVASIISSKASLTAWPRGVYPGARILPIKVCCTDASDGQMTNSHLLREGILYAAGIPNDSGQASAERARVINISFLLPMQYDLTLLDAIEQATAAGSIIVTSVGEGAPRVSQFLEGMSGVIGVMTAPAGGSRPLTDQPIPVIPAPATGILALMPAGTLLAPIASQAPVTGSSFATAVASAVAAMLVAKNPELSPAQVVSILSDNAIYDDQGLDALLAVQKADAPAEPSADAGGAASGGALDALALLVLLGLGGARRRST